MGGSSICLLRPEELELLVCGTPHLNFHELEEMARYEGCVCFACVCVCEYVWVVWMDDPPPSLSARVLSDATRNTQQIHSGYDAKHPVVRWFWETVHEMDLESQRKLLMFVTGSFKAPIGGLGKLSLLLQCAGPDSDSLPTSHTCYNALLLPRYASKQKLQRLLRIAINECQGFGLQ